jgi:flavin-dependent dehydrogenase
MESWDFLKRIGLNLDELVLPKLNQLLVSSPSGNVFQQQLDLGGFGISRYLLDSKLAELASIKGVKLMQNTQVNDVLFANNQFKIITTNGSFFSNSCVGAWGKKSKLDNKLHRTFLKNNSKQKNYVGIKYHIQIDFAADKIELHNFENGYCGISRIEENKLCLCYLTDATNLKRYKGNIQMMEQKIVMENPFLKRYFQEAKFLFEQPLAISQITIGYKNAVENHILMAGDCAGNIAPLSGNGMSMAMRSSYTLAVLLEDYFTNKSSREQLEKQYKLFWKKSFKRRIQFSRILQALLKNKRLTNIAIYVLSKFPFLGKNIVANTHGKPF